MKESSKDTKYRRMGNTEVEQQTIEISKELAKIANKDRKKAELWNIKGVEDYTQRIQNLGVWKFPCNRNNFYEGFKENVTNNGKFFIWCEFYEMNKVERFKLMVLDLEKLTKGETNVKEFDLEREPITWFYNSGYMIILYKYDPKFEVEYLLEDIDSVPIRKTACVLPHRYHKFQAIRNGQFLMFHQGKNIFFYEFENLVKSKNRPEVKYEIRNEKKELTSVISVESQGKYFILGINEDVLIIWQMNFIIDKNMGEERFNKIGEISLERNYEKKENFLRKISSGYFIISNHEEKFSSQSLLVNLKDITTTPVPETLPYKKLSFLKKKLSHHIDFSDRIMTYDSQNSDTFKVVTFRNLDRFSRSRESESPKIYESLKKKNAKIYLKSKKIYFMSYNRENEEAELVILGENSFIEKRSYLKMTFQNYPVQNIWVSNSENQFYGAWRDHWRDQFSLFERNKDKIVEVSRLDLLTSAEIILEIGNFIFSKDGYYDHKLLIFTKGEGGKGGKLITKNAYVDFTISKDSKYFYLQEKISDKKVKLLHYELEKLTESLDKDQKLPKPDIVHEFEVKTETSSIDYINVVLCEKDIHIFINYKSENFEHRIYSKNNYLQGNAKNFFYSNTIQGDIWYSFRKRFLSIKKDGKLFLLMRPDTVKNLKKISKYLEDLDTSFFSSIIKGEFEYDQVDIEEKRNLLVVRQGRNLEIYVLSFSGVQLRPFHLVDIGEKKILKGFLDPEGKTLAIRGIVNETNRSLYSMDVSWIGTSSFSPNELKKEEFLFFNLKMLGMVLREKGKGKMKKIEMIFDILKLFYPSMYVNRSGLLEIIALYSDSQKIIKMHLEKFGLFGYLDRLKNLVLLVEKNPENENLKKNLITVLNWLKEKDFKYPFRYFRDKTFYKIMKLYNYRNQDIVEFCIHYLRSEIAEHHGEIKTAGFLKQLILKGNKDIIVVRDNLFEVNEELFKHRDKATNVEGHQVFLSLVKISTKLDTFENKTLIEFFSTLRGDQITIFEPVVDMFYIKIKWFHFLLFSLHLALSISSCLFIFAHNEDSTYFLVPIVLNAWFIIYEFLMYKMLREDDYWGSEVNLLDWWLLIFTPAVLCWNYFSSGMENSTLKYILGCCNLTLSFCLSMRTLIYLRFVNGLRILIQSIKEVMKSIIYFMILMIAYIFIVIATLAAKEQFDDLRGLEDPEKTTFYDKVYFSIKLALGDIGFPDTTADLDDGEQPPVGHDWLYWFVLIFHSIIVVVMLLNLLVGILSNKFDDYHEGRLPIDLGIQLTMIKEAQVFLNMFMRKKNKVVPQGNQCNFYFSKNNNFFLIIIFLIFF